MAADSSNNFWSNPNFEPKRGFRFLIEFTPPGAPTSLKYVAKAVDRPSYNITSTPHAFFNHTFYYPGRVTWNTLQLTLVDAVEPNTSKVLYDYLLNTCIANPTDLNDAINTTITKATATAALGKLVIKEMITDGSSPSAQEGGKWELVNAFATDVNFGSHSYDSEELIDVTLTIQYDWAVYSAN